MADAVQGAKPRVRLHVPSGFVTRQRPLLLALALMALALAAGALPVPLIVFPGFTAPSLDIVAAFVAGLTECVFAVGRNVRGEYRWARSHHKRLPGLMTEWLQLQPAAQLTAA